MIFHLIFPTPFGDAAIIFRKKPFLVLEIVLPKKNRNTLLKSTKRDDPGRPGSHEKALVIKNKIIDYFNGMPIQPPWQIMDMSLLTQLQQSVLFAAFDIPYGQTRSYGDIAKKVGRPQACRFVGTTMGKNPFPIIIPCHRVIKSDGSPGQFGGGTDLKKKLINLEKRNLKAGAL